MSFVSYIAQWRSVAKKVLDRTGKAVKFISGGYGDSMLPTFTSGDVVLVEKISPRVGNLRHGDVVSLLSHLDPNKHLGKRIVAMEGDTVTYFDPLHADATKTVVVPKGHVWIEGDNTRESFDSRAFGPVPYGLINGKYFLRVWPLNSFGLVEKKRYFK
ncbi:mitochondrial ATP-independent inner membrane protease subunit 1a-like isoform X2 [Gastrolobium bilobum]|uniref:mitochondrial ATP-independent inner membrane protease subunit 1a-like isoform X2 n=1 Tax=Gastrolobium bilobum TaxID=150636 RepID=UPI002AB2DCE5|nr:mitochondrial ATP-independent inner membrane protease subunit 1a-like isoform X2 [Gastrolobium bilobum]